MPIQFNKRTPDHLACTLLVSGGASDANVFESTANPWGVDVLITRAILHVTTVATGAATLNIGIGASATTVDDTLIDGLDVNGALGIFDNISDGGTNGLTAGKAWDYDEFLTVAEASGNVDGLVAVLYIEALPRVTD